jgi:hypothetical protein
MKDSEVNPMLNDPILNNCLNNDNNNNNNNNKMNVLILTLDSVSKNQLERSFPLTFKYLKNELENNIFFDHFNTVGENTFPNMVPFFSGINPLNVPELQLRSEMDFYKQIDDTFHDHLPFIWREYEKNGYITMYDQDTANFAVFKYLKNGFRYNPTSFYGQPGWAA